MLCKSLRLDAPILLDITKKDGIRLFYKLTKKQQDDMIADIQFFFSEEREEDISEFAAERVLDFVKESLAPHFYNAGVKDARKIVEERTSALEDELLTLERPLK
ncbi:hypothetical protein BACSP_00365 [Bacillus sp. T2.9-1]|jgi:uncharacterized protein (DUF2164 family)|nr:hypothetical protein BACSP_00365 [Bacillus sp. T2.9-1]